jgi:catechol 2,3-dioxygenase-like lactoylglutathione lyase family enzyme
MKLGYTILYVKDVPRSVAFYEDAFGLTRRFVHEAGMYAEMDTGATTLSFAANGLAKSNLPGGFQENHPSELPLLGLCFLREAPERAIESDRQAGKWGLIRHRCGYWPVVSAHREGEQIGEFT